MMIKSLHVVLYKEKNMGKMINANFFSNMIQPCNKLAEYKALTKKTKKGSKMYKRFFCCLNELRPFLLHLKMMACKAKTPMMILPNGIDGLSNPTNNNGAHVVMFNDFMISILFHS